MYIIGIMVIMGGEGNIHMGNDVGVWQNVYAIIII